MGKNIVLCADGTGNKGGYTPDSNVYSMYHAVEIHDDDNPQVIYYDNGVGTNTNKFLRALGGGVGLGFGTNVRDLYQFLARKYEPGDKVFLFGFSRGAATIRAFAGFVHACGLVDGHSLSLSNGELTKKVKAEFKKYRKLKGKHPSSPPVAVPGESHGVIDIQFLGVWDTVSALGFPKRTDINSLGMYLLNLIFVGMDHLTDKIPLLAHLFYNYELTSNVQFACQALSLDDARTAFWPWVWDEHGRTELNVEQVWFAGMHANVGGGYERSGLSNVTLEWMMKRARLHGLGLRDDKVKEASDLAHAHGRIYDSRDGLAMFYRYHPRELRKLCRQTRLCCMKKLCDEGHEFALPADALDGSADQKHSCNKLLGDIRIHSSVIERMKLRTANYAPTQLPDRFCVTGTPPNVPGVSVDLTENSQWAVERKSVRRWISFRKWLYSLMLESAIVIVVYALTLWAMEEGKGACENGTGFYGHVADTLDYLLPDMFCPLTASLLVDVEGRQIFWTGIAVLVVYFTIRHIARQATITVAERLRRLVRTTMNP